MEVTDRFVIQDLPDNRWAVAWPGYEFVVCDNERKAATLLKILFEEVNVDEAILAIKREDGAEDYTVTIPWFSYHQNPDAAGRFLARRYAVTGVKFFVRPKAVQFKEIMDKRLAWQRLSGRHWQ